MKIWVLQVDRSSALQILSDRNLVSLLYFHNQLGSLAGHVSACNPQMSLNPERPLSIEHHEIKTMYKNQLNLQVAAPGRSN
jgi:hypothetical protein